MKQRPLTELERFHRQRREALHASLRSTAANQNYESYSELEQMAELFALGAMFLGGVPSARLETTESGGRNG